VELHTCTSWIFVDVGCKRLMRTSCKQTLSHQRRVTIVTMST